MATTVLHTQTLGNTLRLEVDGDPNGDVTAPKGSLATDSANANLYINVDGGTTWERIPFGASGIGSGNADVVSATSTITRALDTFGVATGMTSTPGAGTYQVYFSSSVKVDKNGRTGIIAVFANGVQDLASEREVGGQADNLQGVSCHAEVTVADAQAIDVRWKVDDTTADPIATMLERTMVLVKVS